MNKPTNLFCSAFLVLTACDQNIPRSLNCELSHLGPRVSTAPAEQVERKIEAVLFDQSDSGVWRLRGDLKSTADGTKLVEARGYFYQFDDGTFELIADAGAERIVVMPGNEILQERELQGVTFNQGGHVSTGTPLKANCRTSTPESE